MMKKNCCFWSFRVLEVGLGLEDGGGWVGKAAAGFRVLEVGLGMGGLGT